MYTRNRNRGMALLSCMVFLAVLCALATAFAALSAVSIQIADTYHKADVAYRAAESGLEIMRYWLSRFIMPKTTPVDEYLAAIVTCLQNDLQEAGVAQIVVRDDGSIPSVCVDATTGGAFSARLRMDAEDPNLLRLSLTGAHGPITRTIEITFNMTPYEHPVLRYGMATKGALHFPANPTLTGATQPWEADVYVDTAEMIAVEIGGNANFDGNFHLANSDGLISCSGSLQIAGEFGEEALAHHVFTGVDPVPFPTPDTEMFTSLATGPVVDPCVMNLDKGLTLTNATIPAGRNPIFGGTVTIEGVLVIESPNVVTFNQNCQLNGIIVGVGEADNPEDNQIRFTRNFAAGPYPTGEQCALLAGAAGTSILAPGFAVSFTGNFSVVDGVVAAGSLNIAGNACAEIRGTLITYSEDPIIVDGNLCLNFNRAASTRVPGGFDTHRILACDPSSYAMVF